MKKRDINGVLIFNKPLGISSNNIMQRVKYLYNAKKSGHTGALDPMATGMLPICFGESTKFASLLLEGDKSYTVVAKLGERTNTSDSEGTVISTREVNVTLEDIKTVIKNNFIGEVFQTPTIWSALKYKGKPLYEYARQGIEVPRPTRKIVVYDVKIINFDGIMLTMSIDCSKGTYIRTIVDDLGELLGCGAYVFSLHRNFLETFEEYRMYDFEEICKYASEKDYEKLDSLLLPIDTPVKNFEAKYLDDFNTLKLCQGMTVISQGAQTDKLYRVFNEKYGFLGIAKCFQDDRLRGYRLVSSCQKIVDELKSIPELKDKLLKNIKNPRSNFLNKD